MICKSCGAFLSDDLTECPVCGNAVLDQVKSEFSDTETSVGSSDNVSELVSEIQSKETIDLQIDDSPLTGEEIEEILEKEAGEEYDIIESNESDSANSTGMRSDGIYIDQMEDSPVKTKKKLSLTSIITIILAILLVLSAFICVVLIAGNNEDSPLNGAYNKVTGFFSSVFSDNKTKEYGAKDVVAIFGDHNLTNAELSLYYYDTVYLYYVYYYTYYGTAIFDVQTSLFDQEFSENQSWGDYIVSSSIDTWKLTKIACDIIKNENFTIPEDKLTEIKNLKNNIETTATTQGYSSGAEYIKAQYGPFVTIDDYIKYYEESVYYDYYYNQMFESRYRDYLDDNIDTLDKYNVSVRHILISPEVEKDEASLAEAKLKAEQVLKTWQDGGATETLFIELVTEHSDDTASVPYGGLYEDFATGKMVQQFDEWSFDTTRKYGDCEIVETQFGYHIIFFITRTNPDAYTKAQSEVDNIFNDKASSMNFEKFLDKVNIKLASVK